VREVGTPEQQQRLLSPVANGSATGTMALADHPRRWSLSGMTTEADPTADGWSLHGTKYGILAAPDTTEVAVLARVGDGLGAFVVPGAECAMTPIDSLDASRPFYSATFDGVVVPAERALGEPGSPASAAGVRRAVEEATVAMALETVGTSDALFQMVLAYVKDRQQFSVPIGSFQAVKHKMANMFVAIERARSICYFAVAAIAEDAEDRTSIVSMAKAASDDCQRLVCQDSFQSFGGIGFTWEHDSHLFLKRAMTTGMLLGGADDHTLRIAEGMGVAAAS
jgi:alkylation response protein AidB-like acyl-CoA dehydrogenase